MTEKRGIVVCRNFGLLGGCSSFEGKSCRIRAEMGDQKPCYAMKNSRKRRYVVT